MMNDEHVECLDVLNEWIFLPLYAKYLCICQCFYFNAFYYDVHGDIFPRLVTISGFFSSGMRGEDMTAWYQRSGCIIGPLWANEGS